MKPSTAAATTEEPIDCGPDRDLRGLLPATTVAIVKDVWSKFVTLDELMIELFFEKLLAEAPELAEQFGPAVDTAPNEFLRLFDLTVRALDPGTEQMLKEGFREAPAAATARCRTRRDCAAYFAAYDLTRGQWEQARAAFTWAMRKIPHLDELEREDLADKASLVERFFTEAILEPMVAFAEEDAEAVSEPIIAEMRRGSERMLARAEEAGSFFYKLVFERNPEALQFFRTADMDAQGQHLIAAIAFLARAAGRPERLRSDLRSLATVHQTHQIPTWAYPLLAEPLLRTLESFGGPLTPETRRGWEVLFDRVVRIVSEPMAVQERLVDAASEFFDLIAAELHWPKARREKRWSEVMTEIRATGTYTQTFEELEFGARVAWRNAPKCIGRISWRNLIVRDMRHVTDPEAMFGECVEHLRMANNGGNIEIVMTVFRPTRPGERWGPRIWNSQLIRFAGYPQPDGSVIGDRANVALTAAIRRLGWRPPAAVSDFDVLPLVIDVPDRPPQTFELPPEDVLRVPLSHPNAPSFDALGLQWIAVPAITNFRLEIGGIDYGCVPFNGWFMGTEIARNLFEDTRYGRAETIAEALGLDTSSEATLWRDRAFLELNAAVISSFQAARVTLVDHHTASRQFVVHEMREKRAGRECPAQWSWIVPPLGGSTTQVWHQDMRDFHLRPAFSYAADPWVVNERTLSSVQPRQAKSKDRKPLILFASETGTAETYARQAGRMLGSAGPQVMCMDEAVRRGLARESAVLVVTSTHRDGEVPTNGQALLRWLQEQETGALDGLRFAVLGIGNRIYPNFCAAAHAFDAAFAAAGAERAVSLTLADEIAGQADTVKQWIEIVSNVLGSAKKQGLPASRPRVEVAAPGRRRRGSSAANATLRLNEEMLAAPTEDRSTRQLRIELDPGENDSPMCYNAGDHLAIFPENSARQVQRMCAHLGLQPSDWFRVVRSPAVRGDRFAEPFPVERLIAEELDLALPEAPEELLGALRDAASDPDDRATLEKWLKLLDLEKTDPARVRHKDWLRDSYASLPDLLDAFPDCCPPLDVLIDILPRLRPRMYSIASSPYVTPGSVRLIAGMLRFAGVDGVLRTGVGSDYLARLAPGDRLRVAVKPSHRQLPADFDGPLLLVGAGTGLSQLFGVIEDRVARGIAGGPERPVRLYFGCRDEGEFLMRDALLAWRKSGHLDAVTVALSRQAPVKVYVQDALDADAERVLALLDAPDAHIMVCGDARMAQEVADRFLQIFQRDAGLSYQDAARRLRDLRESGRYLEDVWGVQLHRDVMLAQVAREKYDQGSGWLNRLTRAMGARRASSEAILRY
jgi:nitric oxide synthase oxygenase domain/subunit/sulfite reductase alpha subunit-like flavoprotein/hemoglobin-like flavoprotein